MRAKIVTPVSLYLSVAQCLALFIMMILLSVTGRGWMAGRGLQSGQPGSQKKAEELEEVNLNFSLSSNGIIHMFTICHSYLLFRGPPGAQ